MASPVLFFLKEIPKQGLLALSALLGCKSFKTMRVSFGLPRNGMYIFLNTSNRELVSTFFNYKILSSIDFYAWTIIWILYLYKLFFKIV